MAKVLCMFIFIYLLFHVFHLPWKLGLSFNFITYDDDRKVFRFKRTQSKHYSIFLHSSDFQLKQILDIEIKKRERERRDNAWVECWHSRISFGFVLKRNVETRGNESPFFRAIFFLFLLLFTKRWAMQYLS